MSDIDFPSSRGPGDPEEALIHAVLDGTFWDRFPALLEQLWPHGTSRREHTALWMLDTRQQVLQAVNRTGDAI